MERHVSLQNDYSLEELLPIVSELAFHYTGGEHSSITYERAQMLMEAVLYCIHEFRLSQGNALISENVPAEEAYRQGQEIVIDKVRMLQSLYNEMILSFKDYGCLCLRDTVTKDIPAFLKKYESRFAPQETLLTLDYPVQENLEHLTGVSRVLAYLECICREQKYLNQMDAGEVVTILHEYHRDYESLTINIFEIVRSAHSHADMAYFPYL